MNKKKINSALISVYDKSGLEPIIKQLNKDGVTLYSTGGTENFIKSFGINVISVEKLTNFPEILNGRVKTLNPIIFGGILAVRENPLHQSELSEHNIPTIDCVIVDLYPFEKTLEDKNSSVEQIIEKIDIGGVSLLRAAAKNFNDAIVVSSMEDYPKFLEIIEQNSSHTELKDRIYFATRAFATTSHYDTAIFNFFNTLGEHPESSLKISCREANILRYGENPHQKGTFYGKLDSCFKKYNGKELSYNNLLDLSAGFELINEFKNDIPTFAIIKHNNACGAASKATIYEAYVSALSSDPISAFGGVLVSNTQIDKKTAEKINELFFEIILAPCYDKEALEILKSKKNRIILEQNPDFCLPEKQIRSVLGGFLEQQRDSICDSQTIFDYITSFKPTSSEIEDLIFASKICKHSKSNAIVLAKNRQLFASGVGQTSRIDALRQAIEKAQSFGFDLKGAVLASDAFFPFDDGVKMAFKHGISAILQPGGSINDNLSVKFCEDNNMPMVFTKTRHFKH